MIDPSSILSSLIAALIAAGLISGIVMNVVNALKPLWQKNKYQKYFDLLAVIGLNLLACIGLQINVINLPSLSMPPIVGFILTGLLSSFGSTIHYALLKNAKLVKGVVEQLTEIKDSLPKG